MSVRKTVALAALSMLLTRVAEAQMSPPVPPASPPQNCTAPEHKQFDFWVGDWEVYLTDKPDQMVGGSLIEKIYGDCVIRENWRPFTMQNGGSLNNYDTQGKVWRQTWVDSQNSRVDFTGGLRDGKMVMTGLWKGSGGPGKDQLTRMIFSKEAAGAVRQLGEVSSDGGKSWSESFDFTYKPRRKPAGEGQ